MTGGIAALIGWIADIETLKSLLPGLVTMKCNTAIGFTLSGAALWCLCVERQHGAASLQRRIGQGCAVLVLLIASLTLGEYVIGWNLGIDEWLIHDAGTDPLIAPPGRMSQATSFCFILFGLALLSLDLEWPRRHRPAQYLALLGSVCALVALEGYLFGIGALYRFFFFSSIALHTAGLFLVLGVGVLATRPNHGILSIVASPLIGGTMARRTLPWAILLPIIFGWLRWKGEQAGYYDTGIGLALFATSNVIIFATIIWMGANRLNSLHVELDARNQVNQRFTAIVESSVDAIISKTLAGIITSWNPGAEKIFGYTAAEMIGQSIERLIPPERRHEEKEILFRVGRGEAVTPFETQRRHHDGRLIDISVSVSPIRDLEGRVIGASKLARDITKQKVSDVALRQSEERLRLATSAADVMVWIWHVDSGIIVWDKGMFEIYGIAPTPNMVVTYATWAAAVLPEDLPQQEDKLNEIVRTGARPDRREFRIKRATDGKIRFIQAAEIAVKGLDGKVAKIVGVNIDITERREIENELARSLREVSDFKIALDEHAIVAITTPSGRITYVNDKFCAVSKYSREELLGQDHRIVNSGYHPKEFIRDIWQTIGRGNIWKGEIKNRAKDGSFYWVDTTIVPFLDDHGKPIQYMAIRAEITATKQAQEELERSNRDLEQFAYAASHDLQEPLRAVAGCLEVLKRRYADKLDARAEELIGHSVDGANRMQALIEGLLAFSRVGTRGAILQTVSCDEALNTALKNLSTAIHESSAVITRESLPFIRGDLSQLVMLFQNLIGNALKFRGGTAPAIHIGATHADGHWTISVRDNGIGIDPQFFERIFVIFQRLHTRREYPGTGLGLAICKKIIERHGGEIQVESTLGSGSIFHCKFPEGTPELQSLRSSLT
jgi:PAS domain S-box-containing protein